MHRSSAHNCTMKVTAVAMQRVAGCGPVAQMLRQTQHKHTMLTPTMRSTRRSSLLVRPSALFRSSPKPEDRKTVSSKQTIIPEPAFNIPIVLVAYEGATPFAALLGLLGVFLGVQTTRVRFVFDDEALEVKVGEQLDESGPNAFVGGKNRWTYDSFVNWEFWWPGFPVLVYFKETQTKPEGQIHFFPVLFNGKQLYDVMQERCGPSKTSSPQN